MARFLARFKDDAALGGDFFAELLRRDCLRRAEGADFSGLRFRGVTHVEIQKFFALWKIIAGDSIGVRSSARLYRVCDEFLGIFYGDFLIEISQKLAHLNAIFRAELDLEDRQVSRPVPGRVAAMPRW